jgi:hypothetical protein
VTLILTRASKDYVLQVTDRLVTQQGRPFDAASNKNVLYCAQNGIVAIGYTGLAYLGGVPTDQWIVETIAGFTFERDRKPPAISFGAFKLKDLGQSLLLLRKSLESAPVSPKWSSVWRASPFDVCVAGWQWSKNRCRPVIAWLSKARNSLAVELGSMPRYWHWERSQQQCGFKYKVVAAPDSNLSREQLEMLGEALKNCTADQSERTMVEMMRKVSLSLAEVGPHCMSILLSPPSDAYARIRYIPLGAPAIAEVSRPRGPKFILPVAFTPWLVGPGVVSSPSIASGTCEQQVGHYKVTLEAPQSPESGILGLFSSQQRPNSP